MIAIISKWSQLWHFLKPIVVRLINLLVVLFLSDWAAHWYPTLVSSVASEMPEFLAALRPICDDRIPSKGCWQPQMPQGADKSLAAKGRSMIRERGNGSFPACLAPAVLSIPKIPYIPFIKRNSLKHSLRGKEGESWACMIDTRNPWPLQSRVRRWIADISSMILQLLGLTVRTLEGWSLSTSSCCGSQ